MLSHFISLHTNYINKFTHRRQEGCIWISGSAKWHSVKAHTCHENPKSQSLLNKFLCPLFLQKLVWALSHAVELFRQLSLKPESRSGGIHQSRQENSSEIKATTQDVPAEPMTDQHWSIWGHGSADETATLEDQNPNTGTCKDNLPVILKHIMAHSSLSPKGK